MKNKTQIIASLCLVAALVLMLLGGCNQGTQTMGVTNLDSLHLSDSGGTATPVLLANQTGTGAIAEFQYNGTPVWAANTGGVVSGGALDMGNNLITNIGNAGTDFTSGGGLTTAAGIGVTAGGLTVTAGKTNLNGGLAMDTSAFEVADTSGNTMVGGTLLVTGATSLQAAANMNNAVINNIGNAGTDFGSDGGLTTAAGVNVTAGGLTVTAGSTELNGGVQTDGGLFKIADGSGNTFINGTLLVTSTVSAVGALRANGGLSVDTTAFEVADVSGNTMINGTLLVTSTVTAGGALAANGGLSVDGTAFEVADVSGNTQINGTLNVTGTTTHQAAVNMSNAVINNIGNAGTDFNTDGGLTVANGITFTAGSLKMGGTSSFSALQSGTASCLKTGTQVTHLLGNTPTAVNLTLYSGAITATLSQTLIITGMDSTTFWCAATPGAEAALTALWTAIR
jgi:hypothetical protein